MDSWGGLHDSIVFLALGACAGTLLILATRNAAAGGQGTALVRLQSLTPGVAQTGHVNVSGTVIAGQFAGQGGGLTALNANSLTSGTLPGARLSGAYANAVTLNNASNVFTGNGSGLTALNATNLVNGTVADARLSTNVALLSSNQTFSGFKVIGGGMQLPNGAAAGKFLTSDAVGVFSWANLPAPTGAAGGDLSGTYPNPMLASLATSLAKVSGGLMTSSGGGISVGAVSPTLVGAANFVVNDGVGGFGGMYVNTSAIGQPFYGYAHSGLPAAYTVLDGLDSNKWKLYNGGPWLTVTTNGRVGINTTAPTVALDVAGNFNTSGYLNIGSASDGSGNLRFSAANPYLVASSYIVIPNGAFFDAPVYFDGQAQFRNGIQNDSSSYLTIGGGTSGASYFSGNVGIGTTSPTAALDVAGNINTSGYLNIGSAPDSSGNLRFSAANPYLVASSYFIIPNGAYFSGGTVYFQGEAKFRNGIQNDSGPYLTIGGGTAGISHFSGKVGIGTTTPSEALELRGGAGPTSMTLQPGKHFGGNVANKATIDIAGTGDLLLWDNVHVSDTFTAGIKNFLIDHPLDPYNMFLRHSCVESNEYKNLYDGTVTTDAKGYATVTVPDWFTALNESFRYQLTVIEEDDSDNFVMAKVARVLKNNAFVIRTNMPTVTVSWQITGVRKDAYAKSNPLKVEEQKPDYLRGKLIHPASFGEKER